MQTEKKEEKGKQIWTRPELIGLDHEKTEASKFAGTGEYTNAGRDYGAS